MTIISSVLVIYTGGTIGSKPRDAADPDSPQIVVPWPELEAATPELGRLAERGLATKCISFEKPLDSCNIGPGEWARMAQIIYDNYDDHEGFVILHGTDTMVFSASVLSFMLRNLGKPVVLTGAQRSALVDVRNDATQNFITALLLAAPSYSRLPVVAEVMIYFGGMIYRGNRTNKDDTAGYNAYRSPNLPPLGEAGDKIVLNEAVIHPRPGPEARFHIRTKLDTNVIQLLIFPGISAALVQKQLELPGLRAVLVHAFGSGNIPTAPEFVDVFRRARERGIILVDVSQCRRGPVELGIYETSAMLLEAGFIAAADLTWEAAQCKLMSLLADPDMSNEEVEAAYQVAMAGEQSTSIFVSPIDAKAGSISVPSQARKRLPARPLLGTWQASRIQSVLLRLRRAQVTAAGERATFRVFINAEESEELRSDAPNCAGVFEKWSMSEEGLVIFDVTKAVRGAITRPGERVSFTIVADTEGASLSWSVSELAIIINERSK